MVMRTMNGAMLPIKCNGEGRMERLDLDSWFLLAFFDRRNGTICI